MPLQFAIDEVTRAQEQIRVVEYRKAKVSVTKGTDAGLTVDLATAALRVGTSSENDLVLTDETVSRRHCEIMLTEHGVRVVDVGSTNGVMMSGHRIQDATLSGSVILQLGGTQIHVTPVNETVRTEQLTDERFGDLLGRSAKMRELFAALLRISPTELCVLIEGETGTGKELVAESIHAASPRAGGPFVVFDCSAVAPTLAESELFGHERGAFTGAMNSRQGVFEQAHGGTIFLDELGELPKDLQPKLLRVLEKREVRRVGGSKTIPIDVRVIAATNRNLRSEVARGEFREDLFYRVAGAHVYVPPLRERMDDLPLLVASFLKRGDAVTGVNDIPEHIWEMFRAYRWPGNVRELRNAVARVLVTPEWSLDSDTKRTEAPAAGTDSQDAISPLRVARRNTIDAFERSYLMRVLAKTGGNMARAAALAEVSRQAIHSLVIKHGLL
jgi:transcriptional regulator with GAF, ATPase, and Fis domain